MTEDLPAPSDRNFLFYDTEDGTTRFQLLVDGDSAWMPQIAIAELFETSKQNVGQHIKNIVADSELSEDSVVKDYFTTATDGKKYRTKHFNLDMILSVISVPLCFKSFLAEKMEGLTRELATQFHESDFKVRNRRKRLGLFTLQKMPSSVAVTS